MHFPHFNVPLFYRRPFVVTVHDLILFHYPTPRGSTLSAPLYFLKYLAYRVIIAGALRRAARVVTVSRFTACDITKNFPAVSARITVTPEAVEKRCEFVMREEYETTLRGCGLQAEADVSQRFVLYVGNAYPHKNLESVLAVAPDFPDIRFVFVGREDFFLRRLRTDALRHGIGNVLFAGEKTDRELSVLYRAAELYVFPSLYEGFGLPPLEAMSYGLRVVAARRGALPEIIGAAATFYDPAESGALAHAIRALLSCAKPDRPDTAMLETLARYDWERMATATRDIYQQSISPV
jgi:glycosyltransferase involved in cell wall biosynthesis